MIRFTKTLVSAVTLMGIVVGAGSALAAGNAGNAADAAKNLECTVTKAGKATTKMVASEAECTKLSGKIVEKAPHPKSTKY